MGRSGILLVLLFFFTLSASAMEWRRLMIGDLLVIRVEVANTTREQMLGLGNRDGLPEGTGMLFQYSAPGERIFWMKRMRFPIDILWIRNGQIVFIEHRVPPPHPFTADKSLKRYGIGILADSVLELPAGYAERNAIVPGQSIRLDH